MHFGSQVVSMHTSHARESCLGRKGNKNYQFKVVFQLQTQQFIYFEQLICVQWQVLIHMSDVKGNWIIYRRKECNGKNQGKSASAISLKISKAIQITI
jgi:hypothetical protein